MNASSIGTLFALARALSERRRESRAGPLSLARPSRSRLTWLEREINRCRYRLEQRQIGYTEGITRVSITLDHVVAEGKEHFSFLPLFKSDSVYFFSIQPVRKLKWPSQRTTPTTTKVCAKGALYLRSCLVHGRQCDGWEMIVILVVLFDGR